MKTKGFFGKYFFYKMRGFCGLSIVSAVFNFLSAALLGAAFWVTLATLNDNTGFFASSGNGGLIASVMFGAICISVIAMMIISALTPIFTFKIYNKRDAIDTLGCLPLSYRERFWGDYLSGICANLISFIPCSVLGLIFVIAAQNGPVRELQRKTGEYGEQYVMSGIRDNFAGLYLLLIMMILTGYIGTYAISGFISSCCGKTGSSIVYSVIAMFMPLGVAGAYGTFFFDNAVGVESGEEIAGLVSMLPPLGPWMGYASMYAEGYSIFDMQFPKLGFGVGSPIYTVVLLVIIAALVVGAYFAGKYRKNERTGNDFVYSGAYYVISIIMTVFVIGFYFMMNEREDLSNVLFSIIIALVLYVVVELAHTKSVKKLWQTLLRFAGIYAVCFGFVTLVRTTNGFGIEKMVPSADSVAEVRVSGWHFYTDYWNGEEDYIYRSDEAVSTILSEHKNIIENPDDYDTGREMNITYVLKNGSEISRHYVSIISGKDIDSSPLREASERIRRNEPYNSGVLGFIDDPQYDSISIGFGPVHVNSELGAYNGDAVYVREDKAAELLALLKHDILNNYERFNNAVGKMEINYTLNGVKRSADYIITRGYADTLAFLEDPENLTDEKPEEVELIHIITKAHEDDAQDRIYNMRATFRSDSELESAKELMGYFRNINEVPAEEISERFDAYSSGSFTNTCLAKEDDEAVMRAMLKYIDECRSME